MDTDFEELFMELLRNTKLARKTDLRDLWLLHERLVKQPEYDGWYWIYPAVGFVAKCWVGW